MSLLETLAIAMGLGLLALLILGTRFPRGRFDWPWDRSRTARGLVSLGVLLFTLGVSYYAFSHISWPDAVTNFIVLAVVLLAVLAGVSVLLPRAATR